MVEECIYTKKPKLIEAGFYSKAVHSGETGQSGPRIVLSAIAAGNLRYHGNIPNKYRQDFLKDIGIAENRILAVNLAHSRRILIVSDETDAQTLGDISQANGGVDGLITTNPWFIPTVTVADCMPIWLWVEGCSIFGVLHSGWKGTGILRTAVETLQSRLGVPANKIHVILGPAIGSCCYSVEETRAKSFAEEFGEHCITRRNDSWFMDLRKANENLAKSLGLGSVKNISICTQCDQTMGSSRREGQDSFTRMLALCGFF